MPIPTPTPDQGKEDFMASCMADGVMVNEYPDNAQRYAVCQAQWDEKREGKFTPNI